MEKLCNVKVAKLAVTWVECRFLVADTRHDLSARAICTCKPAMTDHKALENIFQNGPHKLRDYMQSLPV